MQNIRVYVGKNGSLTLGNGKTLCMIIDSYNLFLEGFKILSNFKVNFANKYFDINNILDILKSEKNSIILADEISTIANAYNIYAQKTKGMFKLTRQLRKNGNYLFLTAQVYNDIPASIRRLGNDIIITEKIHPNKNICKIPDNKKCEYKNHFYKVYTLDGTINNILFSDLFFIENNEIKVKKDYFYKQYDTKEIIYGI